MLGKQSQRGKDGKPGISLLISITLAEKYCSQKLPIVFNGAKDNARNCANSCIKRT